MELQKTDKKYACPKTKPQVIDYALLLKSQMKGKRNRANIQGDP